MSILFANLILPIPIPKLFTYQVPEDLSSHLEPGHLVLAQFGNRKVYTAIVHSITEERPDYKVKPILGLEESLPVLTLKQLDFWQWLASYYMCSLGEVFNASLPAAFRLQSESKLILNHNSEILWDSLDDRSFLLMEALQNQDFITLEDASKILEIKNPMPVIKDLLAREYLLIEETLKDKIKPRVKNYAKLIISENELSDCFDKLKNSPKQSDILMIYLQLKNKHNSGLVEEKLLLEQSKSSKPSLDGLYAKEVFEKIVLEAGVQVKKKDEMLGPKMLNSNQQLAFDEISNAFANGKPALLHGVTSSGKTEIYIRLISNQIEQGRNSLYLLPEIALTAQLIKRLEYHFKENLLVYHSKMNNRERLEVWNRILKNDRSFVVIGARSAVFLPFSDLGLVIVDEEHETAFKQHDPAPRYNGRDAAIMLSYLHKSQVLLGSATPSIESYYNAKIGKYVLVELFERFGGVKLPTIEVVDIKEAHKTKTMRHQFSPRLIEEVEATLAEGNKVILFQNRRGFAPVLKCLTCGHTPQCKHCDITLTYHKYTNLLRCHYCGYSIPPNLRCNACGSSDLKYLGFGTEQVEEGLKEVFPNQRIARMDLDNTRRKNAFRELVEDFEDGKIDILVGTQMVAKGLDFEGVMLVGVLNADSLFNFPDFRAHERAYQLLVQVAGRSGRREKRGKVLIQTFEPYHEVIKWVGNADFESMSKHEMYERKQFHYPPFVRMIKITLRHKDSALLSEASVLFSKYLKLKLGSSVLGPENPPIARLKGLYQKQIIIKVNKKYIGKKVKSFIADQADRVFLQKKYARVRIIYDVDPS